ncbi:hypothetical protein AC578_2186 [Pseudocercospora eumusae]|uniref:FAD-binding domain-containing protein n=1 Tax=Pseudocercospora eumusae TaxID=321146 RepID=A0A139HHH5_9PEZI|nr:hypothetical protein AC578_2186 [Pseudocercospora eumusae]
MIAQIHMPKWSKGRVVLIADAADCSSPLSGMGTTLAQHLDNLESALSQYENKTRTFVDRAQKLPLGGKLFYLYFIYMSGIVNLIFRLVGPPPAATEVEEYGFKKMA